MSKLFESVAFSDDAKIFTLDVHKTVTCYFTVVLITVNKKFKLITSKASNVGTSIQL